MEIHFTQVSVLRTVSFITLFAELMVQTTNTYVLEPPLRRQNFDGQYGRFILKHMKEEDGNRVEAVLLQANLCRHYRVFISFGATAVNTEKGGA